MKGELSPGEPHRAAQDAMEWLRSFPGDELEELLLDKDNFKVVKEHFIHTDRCANANFPDNIDTSNCICGLSKLVEEIGEAK